MGGAYPIEVTLVCSDYSARRRRERFIDVTAVPPRRPPRTLAAMMLCLLLAYCGPGRESAPAADPGQATDSGGSSTGESSATDAVAAFATFAAGIQDDGAMSAEDIAEGLRLLAGAGGTLGAIPPELGVDLRVGAEHVLLNPKAADVSATIRTALIGVAESIDAAPGGPAIEASAQSIQADRPLTEQGAALRPYFQQVAKALQALPRDA